VPDGVVEPKVGTAGAGGSTTGAADAPGGSGAGAEVDPQLGRLVLRDGDRKVKLRAMKGVLELSQASTSVERSIPANDPEVVRRARGEAPSTP
jgi:uncharacterized spore protein YtfJ